MTGDQQFMYGLLILGVYIFQFVILHEVIRMAIKSAHSEIKEAEKKTTSEESVIFKTNKTQE